MIFFWLEVGYVDHYRSLISFCSLGHMRSSLQTSVISLTPSEEKQLNCLFGGDNEFEMLVLSIRIPLGICSSYLGLSRWALIIRFCVHFLNTDSSSISLSGWFIGCCFNTRHKSNNGSEMEVKWKCYGSSSSHVHKKQTGRAFFFPIL